MLRSGVRSSSAPPSCHNHGIFDGPQFHQTTPTSFFDTGEMMAFDIQPGLQLERSITVDSTRVITFMGEDLRVYETPSMIADIEYACRDLLYEHLPAGFDSVGTIVDIQHLAATPEQEQVRVSVVVEEVDRRRVRFKCEVYDALERVGAGIHERFIVEVAKHRQRLRQKRKKLR